MSGEAISQWIRIWINYVQQKKGNNIKPIVYTGCCCAAKFDSQLITDLLNENRLWIARYRYTDHTNYLSNPCRDVCSFDASKWAFWQWTNQTHIDGIPYQYVDEDILNGDMNKLNTILISPTTNPTVTTTTTTSITTTSTTTPTTTTSSSTSTVSPTTTVCTCPPTGYCPCSSTSSTTSTSTTTSTTRATTTTVTTSSTTTRQTTTTSSATTTTTPLVTVARELPSNAQPSSTFPVSIAVDFDDIFYGCGMVEYYPSGWVISDLSDEGFLKSNPNRIEWIFFAGNALQDQTVTYNITVPANASGNYAFTGIVMLSSSANSTIIGDNSINISPGCYLEGDNPPCDQITISEILDLIINWSQGSATISDVLALIVTWAK